jgi:hypothetical protein
VPAIRYNIRIAGWGTRNEARIADWEGLSSPLLDAGAVRGVEYHSVHRIAGVAVAAEADLALLRRRLRSAHIILIGSFTARCCQRGMIA